MATVGGSIVTLAEVGNLFHGATEVAQVAETLSEENPILRHAIWVESSENFSHHHVHQLALPSVSWRKTNDGVTATSGHTKSVYEPILIAETRSEVDERIVDSSDNPAAVRDRYNRMHIMALAQEFEDKFFYGNAALNPEQPDGLATRYTTANTTNIIDNDASNTGSGDNVSLWIINWDDTTGAYLSYPNGSPLGIEVVDKDIERVSGTNTGNYYAYTTQFKMACAIAVADDRGVQRIGSIDNAYGETYDLDTNHVLTALGRMKSTKNAAIYCNRDLYTQLNITAVNKSNVYYLADSPFGDGPVPHIMGVPIYLCEGLVSTEDAI